MEKEKLMENSKTHCAESPKASSVRWKILRRALLPNRSSVTCETEPLLNSIKLISRKASNNGFGLIPCELVNDPSERDACMCYTLPVDRSPKLYLKRRADDRPDLNDFEICHQYDIDNTGIVCPWPSEEVLAHFCLSHVDMFRSKTVIELGSGYGLAGLVIGAISNALEVVISDGNPQVVDYIQHNIDANGEVFGPTKMKSMNLHWNQDEVLSFSNSFDIIIASDCTFFKEFHKGLARTVKLLLKKTGSSEALFFSPPRGDSLDRFLEEVKSCNLSFRIVENYDAEVWKRHQAFMKGDESWPNYDKDHCYPLLVRITN